MDAGTWVPLARLGGPHGLKGAQKAEWFADSLDVIQAGQLVQLFGPGKGPQAVKIAEVAGHIGAPLLRLEGVDSPEAARAYFGHEIRALREQLPLPQDGSYYIHDLTGLRVLDERLGELGTVEGVVPTAGANDCLEIRPPQGQTWLAPFVQEMLVKVDLKAGCLTLKLPRGLAPGDDDQDEV